MIEIIILNPDGSKFIESPLIIPGEQLKEQDIEAQFTKGNILEFAVMGNKLQGEVISCEVKNCHSPVLDTGESSVLQVTVKIKPQQNNPVIITTNCMGQ